MGRICVSVIVRMSRLLAEIMSLIIVPLFLRDLKLTTTKEIGPGSETHHHKVIAGPTGPLASHNTKTALKIGDSYTKYQTNYRTAIKS